MDFVDRDGRRRVGAGVVGVRPLMPGDLALVSRPQDLGPIGDPMDYPGHHRSEGEEGPEEVAGVAGGRHAGEREPFDDLPSSTGDPV